MRVLHLHIGHDKTGSSYIQNSLRKSRDLLRERHGIWYPPSRDRAVWTDASFTSGNARGLLADRGALRSGLELGRDFPEASMLFSSEFLFRELGEARALDLLESEVDAAGFGAIRILLFIRNPIEFTGSFWQQHINTGGGDVNIENFFKNSLWVSRVCNFIEDVHSRPRFSLRVANYSVHRQNLLSLVTEWLGVPPDALVQPDFEKVNRSLTPAELELQRQINRRLGQGAPAIATRFVERLPEHPHSVILPDLEVQQAAWDRMLPAIERINAHLPEAERYRQDFRDPPPRASEFVFDAAQLDVVAELIAELSETARHLRASALSNASGWALGRALLARIARRLRLR